MAEVFIALGTNVGDRAENLKRGLEHLEPLVALTGWSPVYDTPPQYVTDQPSFLNMVVCGETVLDATVLLERLKALETELGRLPGKRFGPRLIDFDILFYGEAVIDLPTLAVPHPRMAEREFVLRPLADLVPDKRHPVTGKTVAEMLNELPGATGIIPFRSSG